MWSRWSPGSACEVRPGPPRLQPGRGPCRVRRRRRHRRRGRPDAGLPGRLAAVRASPSAGWSPTVCRIWDSQPARWWRWCGRSWAVTGCGTEVCPAHWSAGLWRKRRSATGSAACLSPSTWTPLVFTLGRAVGVEVPPRDGDAVDGQAAPGPDDVETRGGAGRDGPELSWTICGGWCEGDRPASCRGDSDRLQQRHPWHAV